MDTGFLDFPFFKYRQKYRQNLTRRGLSCFRDTSVAWRSCSQGGTIHFNGQDAHAPSINVNMFRSQVGFVFRSFNC